MVQSVNNMQANNYGSIERVGEAKDNRVIYELKDGDGKKAGKITVASKDCDVFEKSYQDIIETAPKLQKYALKNSSPEKLEKKKKLSKRIVTFSTILGFAIPAIAIKKGSTLKKALLSLGGLIAGLAGGYGISLATTTPPGAMKFTKATNNLNRIDIQPYKE